VITVSIVTNSESTRGSFTIIQSKELEKMEPWKIVLGELDEKMGVKVIEESAERVVATMPVEGNRQSLGLLHGGAMVSLAEAVGSWAAVIHASTMGKVCVGVDI